MHHLQPGVAVFILQDCIEVCLDCVRVTFLAIGEGDTRADVEGVYLTILADIPAFCQAAFKAIGGDVDKTLVEHFLCVHLAGI